MFLVVSSVKREISSSPGLLEIYMNEIINKLKPRKGGEINRGSSIRRQAGQGEREGEDACIACNTGLSSEVR